MRQQSVPKADAPIARRKLGQEVLERLLARVHAGEFQVGSLLPSERELMQHYAVGRPAVREALQSLARMGFVAIVHGEGARVLPLSADSVIDQISDSALHLFAGSSDLLDQLRQARLAFEVSMARQAAARVTPEHLAPLGQALQAHRDSLHDPDRFLATDMAFHHAIAAMSGNAIYGAVSQAMLQWLERFHHEAVRAPGAEQVTLDEHIAIYQCIAAGDVDGAGEAVIRHLRRADRQYRTDRPSVDA